MNTSFDSCRNMKESFRPIREDQDPFKFLRDDGFFPKESTLLKVLLFDPKYLIFKHYNPPAKSNKDTAEKILDIIIDRLTNVEGCEILEYRVIKNNCSFILEKNNRQFGMSYIYGIPLKDVWKNLALCAFAETRTL